MTTYNFRATVESPPRIGPNRELKHALESYWAGDTSGPTPWAVARELNAAYAKQLRAAGLDSVPWLGISLYDQMLDMTAALGVLPARFTTPDTYVSIEQLLAACFATARGTAEHPAAAMTKWFDTNYHYIVPELESEVSFSAHPELLLDGIAGPEFRPVLIGPYTFLRLARRVAEGQAPRPLTPAELSDLLPSLTQAYVELIGALAATGVRWIQVDEPALMLDVPTEHNDAIIAAYETLAGATQVRLLVATYFGDGNNAVELLQRTPVAGIAVDLVTSAADPVPAWDGTKLLVAGVIDGRNVWRTDLRRAKEQLQALQQRGPIAVSTSCSLLHVPYSLEPETALDAELRRWLAFGASKIDEVGTLARLLGGTARPEDQALVELSARVWEERRTSPRIHNEQVRDRARGVTEADRRRTPFDQRPRPELPVLPTTTIGSFPQTKEIRSARARLRQGVISAAEYDSQMVAEVRAVIRAQEELGLDVLVHGEPERNDMVQYFSEQLDGYAATDYGWVQSYGSRCVRPPILYGDVSRPAPMTVRWFEVAQRATEKPVKGMLTGPVTMLAWSFVRDDQPLSETADQVALALRDEVADLEAAGARFIQVDEPAIRELLPLRAADQPAYLAWATGAFRLATSRVSESTQIHTHMCYSQFAELIDTILDLDADVTSIESSRAGMGVLQALAQHNFHLGIGPGIWDIHSPRVPSEAEIEHLLRQAVRHVDPALLWVNPDCGLKTRGWAETTASLQNLVAAAHEVRATITA